MCGICGFYGRKDKKLLDGMMGVLAHRGPDDEGTYEDNFVSLGHRRLSIIDLSQQAREPLTNEDGSIQLIFNGEIYNFEALRKILESCGHRFLSNTDAEVVVHAYEEFGDGFIKRLNGMFAFCIWDRKNKKLLLARDRIGIKPLYYAKTKDRFLFASEAKSILKDDNIDRRVSRQGFGVYMAFQCIPGDFTMFDAIKKVPPAHTLTLKDGIITLNKYWELERTDINIKKDYVEKIKDLLTDSVRLRLISDVPLGVLLSGGLDSSILTALAARSRGEPVQTFSVGFGQASDELPYAKIVAEKFKTKHHELIIKPESIEDMLSEIVWHMDEPLADGGAIATYFACRALKSKVKVVLVGEGSDEIFGGYSWHRLSCGPFNLLPYQLKKRIYFYLTTFYKGGDCTIFDNFSRAFENFLSLDSQDNLFEKMSQFEVKHILPNSLLMKVDKMTMAHSIEARVPFLDHRIVEYMYNLSHALGPGEIVGKKIIRKCFGSILPQEVLRRKKHGFILPVNKWLFSDIKDFVRDVLMNKRKFFPVEIKNQEIEKLLVPKKHPLGAIVNTAKLWRLLIFQLWGEKFLKNG